MAEITVGGRRTRIEVDRAPERRDRLLRAPFHHGPVAERDLSPRIAIVERNRPEDVLAAGEQALVPGGPAVMCCKYQAKTQEASGRRVVRISLDGALERPYCSCIVRSRETPDIRLCARHELPGSEIIG